MILKTINYMFIFSLLAAPYATHAMDFGNDYNFGPSREQMVELYTHEKAQQKLHEKNQKIVDTIKAQREQETKKIEKEAQRWEEALCRICLETPTFDHTDDYLYPQELGLKNSVMELFNINPEQWILTPCCQKYDHWDCTKRALLEDPRCIACRKPFLLPQNIQALLTQEERNYFLEKGFLPKPPVPKTPLAEQIKNFEIKLRSWFNGNKDKIKGSIVFCALIEIIYHGLLMHAIYTNPEETLSLSARLLSRLIGFGVVAGIGISLIELMPLYLYMGLKTSSAFYLLPLAQALIRFEGYAGTKIVLETIISSVSSKTESPSL